MAVQPPLQDLEQDDWIAKLLNQGPERVSLDALQTDPSNILSGESSSGVAVRSSDQSCQSQEQQLSHPAEAVALLNNLDLPALNDLLDDAFWEDFDTHEGVPCPPSCHCQQLQGQCHTNCSARRQGGAPEQLLSSWNLPTGSQTKPDSADSVSAEPEGDTTTPAQWLPDHDPPAYPTSSQDSSHRPASQAEVFQDTCCTPEAACQALTDTTAGSCPLPQQTPQQEHGPVGSHQPASAQRPAFVFGQSRVEQPTETPSSSSGNDPEEVKRAARMQRNRESAHYSRQRKKMQAGELERRCQELQTHNIHLTGMVKQLSAEVTVLRHQLVMATSQGVMQPGAMPGSMGMHMPAPLPGHAAGITPAGLPMMAPLPTPKLPIQKLAKPSRPDPAPAKHSKQGAPGGASRPSKRVRTVAAASAGATAVLALCALLVIGPSNEPLQGSQLGGSGYSMQHAARLPARSLQSLASDNHGDSEHAIGIIQAALEGVNASDWSPVVALNAGNASGWEPVTLRPSDKDAQDLALQRLKELAPVAMVSDWGQAGSRALSTSAPQFGSFSQLASSVLGQSGLLSPSSCREVFTFDATSLVDVGAARAALRRYLASLATFRGRSLGALPLPPIGGTHPASEDHEKEEAGFRQRQQQTIGCGEDSEVLVSMMLPTRQAAEGAEPSLTGIDQVFVVVLKPGKQYTTYSCGLEQPVFV